MDHTEGQATRAGRRDLEASLASTYFLHGNAFIHNLAITLAPVDGGGDDCGR